MKTYSDKSNARRAARAALGKDAKEDADFRLIEQEGRYGFEALHGMGDALSAGEPLPPPAYSMQEGNEASSCALPNNPSETPEMVKLALPDDPLAALGATPEALALIAAAAEARCVTPQKAQRKELSPTARPATLEAWKAAKAGVLPPPLQVPASNAHVAKRADALRKMAEEGRLSDLHAEQIGGTNTYAKALRSYRDALIAYLQTAFDLEAADAKHAAQMMDLAEVEDERNAIMKEAAA